MAASLSKPLLDHHKSNRDRISTVGKVLMWALIMNIIAPVPEILNIRKVFFRRTYVLQNLQMLFTLLLHNFSAHFFARETSCLGPILKGFDLVYMVLRLRKEVN